MKRCRPLVVGYPRTGFTLLISVIAEIGRYAVVEDADSERTRRALKAFCDTAGMQIASRIDQVFDERGLAGEVLYNANFRQMVGGPKWMKEDDADRACFRKYIGIRGQGDFTLITAHPRQVLGYYEIVHSHVAPERWAKHSAYQDYRRFTSIRHPAGTLASACFSLNALASEHIQRFVPPEKDNDMLRQQLALYKLSDLNFFEALLTPFKAYLEAFSRCADQYVTMRWEDLIQAPLDTIQDLAAALEIPLDRVQASEIWQRLDHVNLTGAHRHNLRQGHGIVGGWRRWLTNTHLDMMRDYGLDAYARQWGYGPIGTLDEAAFTPFQHKLAEAIAERRVIREYDDDDLFGFAFNKSNLDLDRFDFKRYPWRTHTRIERSSGVDEAVVLAVSDAAEQACATVNRALDEWLDAADDGRRIEASAALLAPLYPQPGALASWRQGMRAALSDVRPCGHETPPRSEPVLLRSMDTTNIVGYEGHYYALPQSLGPIDFHRQDVANLPGVLIADNMAALLLALTKISS